MDQAAFGIESAQATVESVGAMKAANIELKKALKTHINIDEVDDLADDMEELMYDMNGECDNNYFWGSFIIILFQI